MNHSLPGPNCPWSIRTNEHGGLTAAAVCRDYPTQGVLFHTESSGRSPRGRDCPETHATHGGSEGWSSGGCEGMFLTETSALARGRDCLETTYGSRARYWPLGTQLPHPTGGSGRQEDSRYGRVRAQRRGVRSELAIKLDAALEESTDLRRHLASEGWTART